MAIGMMLDQMLDRKSVIRLKKYVWNTRGKSQNIARPTNPPIKKTNTEHTQPHKTPSRTYNARLITKTGTHWSIPTYAVTLRCFLVNKFVYDSIKINFIRYTGCEKSPVTPITLRNEERQRNAVFTNVHQCAKAIYFQG
uniref:Uncharacterized protein n=1 Tax=Cacopsylla melanoneura TaxID=428564 RepID=A0A8D8Q2F9_9HEMI